MNFQTIFSFILNKIKILAIIFLFIIISLKIIDLSHMRITAIFNELEPFSNIYVYYKGFKIGKTINVRPSKDFLTTEVTIALNSWNYNLPNNIKVKVQKAQKDSDIDYIDIIYPSSPAIARLKYGDKVEGTISHDLSDIINDVAEGKNFNEIKGNANNLLSSANDVAKSLNEFITVLTSILNEIRPDIKITTNNLAKTSTNLTNTSANLEKTSIKIEKSINDEYILNSIQNLQSTSKNVESTTLLLNSKTIPKINATICSLKILIDNINEIVKGIGKTLQKRMGGARLIFGTAVDNKCN